MKVLLVQPVGHLIGGVPADIALFCNALSELDVDVTLVTYDGLLVETFNKVKHVSVCSRFKGFASILRRADKILGFKRVLEIKDF